MTRLIFFMLVLTAFAPGGRGAGSISLDWQIPVGLDENPTFKFGMSFGGVVERGARAAATVEANPQTATLKDLALATQWHLARFKFVQAERLAEQWLSRTTETNTGLLYLAGITKFCRGDYQEACRHLDRIEAVGEYRSVAHLRLGIRIVLLGQADAVAGTVRAMIIAREMNHNPMAMRVVLATCRRASSGKEIFDALLKRIDRTALLQDLEAAQGYLLMCQKHGHTDEFEAVRKMAKDLPPADR